eukprot:TRINITY_DN923_c1_g1_i5.p1 TRINITY_DN923_c1_g1~~TRINITY_DN923_c1_g1_i5.p1  ORF type:complete len:161 (-),score=16.62 TRINITY_DN923_c1_g1_i5:543-1025(-)
MESSTATKRLFSLLDIDRDGKITMADLRTITKSLQLFPPPKKLKQILNEVDKTGRAAVGIEAFREMRRSQQACELNVIAEFKKFDVDWLHRGFVTPAALERVLEDEGFGDDAISKFVADFMSCDSNGDGMVSYRDLHERMLGRVPGEWLEWLAVRLIGVF